MKKKSVLTAAVILLAAVFFTVGYFLIRHIYKDLWDLPRWVRWEEKRLVAEDNAFVFDLKKKTVQASKDGEPFWQSEEGVYVQDMILLNIDGSDDDSVKEELILLVWKRGSYGPYQPFWEEKNDTDLAQHIFIYTLEAGEVHPVWMSSTVSDSIVSMTPEGQDLRITFQDGHSLLWGWRVWGLELIEDESSREFSTNQGNEEKAAEDENAVTILALGDLILHQPLIDYGQNHGGYDFLFDPMRGMIQNADIALLNQETPLVTDKENYSDYPFFGTPVEVVDAIQKAGFDLVSLATNHALDQGEKGLATTIEAFATKDILTTGTQAPEDSAYCQPYVLMEAKGITFAFLNYTYGTNGQALPEDGPFAVHLLKDPEHVKADIEAASKEADIIIVLVHWGEEYILTPTPEEEEWAGLFLACGVDVVIGTHPHVLQPMEVLTREDGHQMLIYYSLGNYVSGQGQLEDSLLSQIQGNYGLSEEEAKGLLIVGGMASFTVSRDEDGTIGIVNYDLIPVICHQAYGLYTGYLLGDYPEEMAKIHRLGIQKDSMEEFFDSIIN